MRRFRFVLAFATLSFLVGCGQDCSGLAQRYAAELPKALSCDPAVPVTQCGVARPVVSYVQEGQNLRLEGLGSCMHSMNPAHTATLDKVLADFYDNGCKLLPLPVCTDVVDRCYVNGQGIATCYP